MLNLNDVKARGNGAAKVALDVLLGAKPAEGGEGVLGYDAIEEELRRFEAEERKKLGLEEAAHAPWVDENPKRFTRDQREHTTMLIGGLTYAQDMLASAALSGVGYKVAPLPVPDYEALRIGKEYGNRGQCNPTYFTVGNLVKHLMTLEKEQGLSRQEVIDRYLFVTAGACGPCRFGTYATEFRKALRDAGFDGFRVLLFEQQGGLKQATGEAQGLELNPRFFLAILRALMAGDVLNALGYRIRPYEVEAGATDRALARCREILADALRRQGSVLWALLRCRRILGAVEVDWLRVRPRVSIIGEFWAMTTEGDGNYKLQQFLESEGAEVDVQLVTAWLLYNVWQHRYDTKRRMELRKDDGGKSGLAGKNPAKKLAILALAERVLRGAFQLYANAIGLHGYHLPDMEEIATISHPYYDNHLRGGEGHMEVGKLIQSVEKKKAHMVISVKPFGCMPSSGVSDGVQSLITAKYPEAIFSAIETTGDGAVNVQSRIQMDLFKARQAAEKEFARALEEAGLTPEEAARRLARSRRKRGPLHHPPHRAAGRAADVVYELAG